MATKTISTFKRLMKNDSLKELREAARNKYRMYAVNAQKAAREILNKRKIKY